MEVCLVYGIGIIVLLLFIFLTIRFCSGSSRFIAKGAFYFAFAILNILYMIMGTGKVRIDAFVLMIAIIEVVDNLALWRKEKKSSR